MIYINLYNSYLLSSFADTAPVILDVHDGVPLIIIHLYCINPHGTWHMRGANSESDKKYCQHDIQVHNTKSILIYCQSN